MKRNVKYVEREIDELLNHREVEKRYHKDRDNYRHQNHLNLFKRTKHLIQILRKDRVGKHTVWLVYDMTNKNSLIGAFNCFYKAQKFAECYEVFGKKVEYKIEGVEVL